MLVHGHCDQVVHCSTVPSFSEGLQTTKAKAAKKHINERIGPWSRRYQFKKPQHYDEGIAEFRSKGGGGSCGVGVTLEFAKAIVKELSQT